MGQPTPPDPTGDDCLCCWATNETPSIVYISFTGIEPCDKPYNGIPFAINEVVTAYQDDVAPCYFENDHPDWLIVWSSCPDGFSACRQAWKTSEMFLHTPAGNCKVLFSNVLDCAGPIIYGHNGNAAVMWNTGPGDHSIGSLLNSINMEPHAKTKFELWPALSERICVRFARKSDATNILILVEPTEL